MLNKLKGRFWTDELQMVKDLNEVINPMWEVVHLDYEMVVIESENEEAVLHLVRAGNTMTIEDKGVF